MATILVVDDKPLNRSLLTTLLGYSGHRLIEASHGFEAIERALAKPPDPTITDILMRANEQWLMESITRALATVRAEGYQSELRGGRATAFIVRKTFGFKSPPLDHASRMTIRANRGNSLGEHAN